MREAWEEEEGEKDEAYEFEPPTDAAKEVGEELGCEPGDKKDVEEAIGAPFPRAA